MPRFVLKCKYETSYVDIAPEVEAIKENKKPIYMMICPFLSSMKIEGFQGSKF
jgi:hypothetical protein